MKNIACFDVGGTFIKYALINEEGSIIFKDKVASPKENCNETIPREMVKIIKRFQEGHNVDKVGISTAGQVDSKKGEIVFASGNLPNYTGTKLSEYIKNALGLDTFVENDVNAAAIGEMWKGAGKGQKNFACVTLGTGIGGAIIINGKLYKGSAGGAGEVGHTILNEEGEKCNCGGNGCYERYASTSSLIRQYKERALLEKIDVDKDINGEKIMKLVHNGDTIALNVYDNFLNHVVNGLVSITYVLDPGTIIIGGGISAEGEEFFKALNYKFKNKVMSSYGSYTKIIPAALQNDAGVYGACYIALNEML
ncbi:ROK family protein [Clostridium algidicarnis]|uniref:Glucokinase n=2 Tax=Clostridium algidicarnis TaxID=37659 RepID=A0A2S6FZ48_9CLOT|nr:ROK family protein [Clostridium algidicarnis]MBB6698215.1 ROK family protein [Clostridium algidicarnis]MBU3194256.1 ROK family protein [Clostridium algidicarnis]MBU3197143.1 ROK family protein [Clostridium algidicarnis]MBU3209782.1 ROK family protein [Clostridium algidicarnis]MBU3220188.1 ROK family protein [Clostridium algidicarnis]